MDFPRIAPPPSKKNPRYFFGGPSIADNKTQFEVDKAGKKPTALRERRVEKGDLATLRPKALCKEMCSLSVL